MGPVTQGDAALARGYYDIVPYRTSVWLARRLPNDGTYSRRAEEFRNETAAPSRRPDHVPCQPFSAWTR
jgi:hypothetical protein